MHGSGSSDLFCFQAEDGIRDIGVTGVQTCALPISRHPRPYPCPRRGLLVMSTQAGFGGGTGTAADGAGTQIVFARYRVRRSEERRVGKERRSRWSPYDVKENIKSCGNSSERRLVVR